MSTPNEKIAEAMLHCFVSPDEANSNLECANIVDGLFAIARSGDRIAKAIERLGVNDAATQMGAIELLASEVKNLRQ